MFCFLLRQANLGNQKSFCLLHTAFHHLSPFGLLPPYSALDIQRMSSIAQTSEKSDLWITLETEPEMGIFVQKIYWGSILRRREAV